MENVLLVNAPLTILLLRETAGGHVHEKRIADTTPYPLPAGSRLLQDLGFLAFTLEPAVLQQDSEDLALLSPVPPKKRSRTKAQPVTSEDALFRLIGIGHSGKGDISANKHQYLAEAYLHHKQA